MNVKSPVRLTRRQLAASSLAGTAALALGGPVSARQTPITAPDDAALRAIVDTFVATTGTPGAMAAVWRGDADPWLYAAGVSDLETLTPLAVTDAVRIASNTKTFVATVVLQLVDEGLLGLDDVVSTWVPDVPNGDTATIRNLLGMTSGIYNWIEAPGIEAAWVADPLMPWSPEQAIDIARQNPPYFAPGEGFHYTETNYFLLGLIAEAVTSTPIDVLITERLLAPNGLTRTSFPTTPDMPEPFSRGYVPDEAGGPPIDFTINNPNFPWTAGAMISTLEDMLAWARLLANGDLISAALQTQRLELTTIATEPYVVGYGLGIFTMAGYWGHNGGVNGYSTFMVHNPDSDTTIVSATNLSTNEGGGADQIFAAISRLLDPSLIPPGAPEASPAG
jgi:D-alanyl-D-alanine carboxypeptidase